MELLLGMLAAGDEIKTILDGYPRPESDEVCACLTALGRYGSDLNQGDIVTFKAGGTLNINDRSWGVEYGATLGMQSA